MLKAAIKIPLIVFSILSIGGGGGYLTYHFTKTGTESSSSSSTSATNPCSSEGKCKCCTEAGGECQCPEGNQKCCKNDSCPSEQKCCCCCKTGETCSEENCCCKAAE